jgi:hypothetical protein
MDSVGETARTSTTPFHASLVSPDDGAVVLTADPTDVLL